MKKKQALDSLATHRTNISTNKIYWISTSGGWNISTYTNAIYSKKKSKPKTIFRPTRIQRIMKAPAPRELRGGKSARWIFRSLRTHIALDIYIYGYRERKRAQQLYTRLGRFLFPVYFVVLRLSRRLTKPCLRGHPLLPLRVERPPAWLKIMSSPLSRRDVQLYTTSRFYAASEKEEGNERAKKKQPWRKNKKIPLLRALVLSSPPLFKRSINYGPYTTPRYLKWEIFRVFCCLYSRVLCKQNNTGITGAFFTRTTFVLGAR